MVRHSKLQIFCFKLTTNSRVIECCVQDSISSEGQGVVLTVFLILTMDIDDLLDVNLF